MTKAFLYINIRNLFVNRRRMSEYRQRQCIRKYSIKLQKLREIYITVVIFLHLTNAEFLRSSLTIKFTRVR